MKKIFILLILFCLSNYISIAQEIKIDKEKIKTIINDYADAHQSENNYNKFIENNYLHDKKMEIFHDFRDTYVPLKEYLSYFWKPIDKPVFKYDSPKIDTTQSRDREYIIYVEAIRVFKGKEKIIIFEFTCILSEGKLINYKIKNIINYGKPNIKPTSSLYLKSIGGNYNYTKTNNVKPINIGATTDVDFGISTFGLSLDFGFSNARFIEGLKLGFDVNYNKVESEKKWEIDTTSNTIYYPVEFTALTAKKIELLNFNFYAKLYAIQTISGWRGKNYWQKSKSVRFDFFGVAGYNKFFYNINTTELTVDLKTSGSKFMYGLGTEIWLGKNSNYSLNLNCNWLLGDNKTITMSIDNISFFNFSILVNFNPLNKFN